MKTLTEEIAKRAHSMESQGSGVVMVLIRLDEILAASRSYRRSKSKERA